MNKNVIIIGLVILGILLVWKINPVSVNRVVVNSNDNSNIGGGASIDKTTNFITISMFDKDGNPIADTPTQSLVNGHSGVASISITVYLTNTGNQSFTCTLNSFSSAFGSSMSGTAKSLWIGQTTSWTSGRINVTPLENLNPWFNVTATCQSSLTTLSKTGGLQVSVLSDNAGDFTINVVSGGIGTEGCGDGICQPASETASSCPVDCTTIQSISFRTSDSSFISGSGVAWNRGSCGTALTKFGYLSTSGIMSGTCASNMPSRTDCSVYGYSSVSAGNGPNTGWLVGGTNPSLWKASQSIDNSILCVCDDNGNQYQYVRYSTSVGTTVSSSAMSTQNPTIEVNC